MDAIGGVEIVLALLASAVGTALTVLLAGSLHGASVLAGGKLTWRAARRAEPVQ